MDLLFRMLLLTATCRKSVREMEAGRLGKGCGHRSRERGAVIMVLKEEGRNIRHLGDI